MNSDQIHDIFMDYNVLFKKIKKDVTIDLESEVIINPTTFDYPIFYYLIDLIDKNDFLKKIQSVEEMEIYNNFFSDYKNLNKREFCKFMDSHGFQLINYINYNNKIFSRIESLSGYSQDELQLYTNFISCELQLEFESKRYTKQVFTVYYQNIKSKITIYYNRKPTQNKLRQLFSLVLFMKFYFKKNIEVDVTLFFIDKDKKIPIGKNKVIGPNNINSGYSQIINVKYNKVCVFRIEEMEKVLVHEMLHALKLDLGYLQPSQEVFTKLNINPNTEITLNESYTEIMALLIIIALKSNTYEKQVDNLNRELKHTIKQVSKILKLNGFKKIEDFVKPYDNLDKYKQNTSVLSYFFIKGGLLYNLSEFMWLVFIQLNKNSINSKLLLDYATNPGYLELIGIQMKKKDNSKSLTMTIIE